MKHVELEDCSIIAKRHDEMSMEKWFNLYPKLGIVSWGVC
jgi:hypothetical protein